MSELGTPEGDRSALVEPGRPFGAIRFAGGRYEHPGLPVFAMAELQRYAKLVSAVAHAVYLEENPKRKRVPNGFGQALDLRLTRVEMGSVVPVLEWVSSDSGADEVAEAYESARRLVDDTFREIGESGHIPEQFPHTALGELAQFGRSLRDDERIELGNASMPAIVNKTVRETIGTLANFDTIEVEAVLPGRITGVRSTPQHQFDFLVAGPEKRRMDGIYSDPTMFEMLREFTGYAGDAPLSSISVLAARRPNGDLTITDVLGIEPALPPEWASRVSELAAIRDGWLDSSTPAPTADVIDILELLLARSVDESIPRPLIFPSGEGGVQLEWREGRGNIEVEIFNNGVIEAIWFDPDGDADIERTYEFSDTESVVELVAGKLNE